MLNVSTVFLFWRVKCVAKFLQSNWAHPWRKCMAKCCSGLGPACCFFGPSISRICTPLAWWLQIFIHLLVPSHFLPSHVSEGSASLHLAALPTSEVLPLTKHPGHWVEWDFTWRAAVLAMGWAQLTEPGPEGMLLCPWLEWVSIGSQECESNANFCHCLIPTANCFC